MFPSATTRPQKRTQDCLLAVSLLDCLICSGCTWKLMKKTILMTINGNIILVTGSPSHAIPAIARLGENLTVELRRHQIWFDSGSPDFHISPCPAVLHVGPQFSLTSVCPRSFTPRFPGRAIVLLPLEIVVAIIINSNGNIWVRVHGLKCHSLQWDLNPRPPAY